MRRHAPASLLTLAFIAVAALGLAACDSSDPVDEPSFSEVAGSYSFTTYRFDPNSSALPTVNILDTLVAANTQMRLFESGQFTLEYQFESGPLSVAAGDYDIRGTRLDFSGDGDAEDRFDALLLGRDFRLNWSPSSETLSGDIEKTVDLEAYDEDRFRDLTDISGVLELRLTRP